MNAWRISQVLLIVLASGTAGWWMRGAEPPGTAAMPAPAPARLAAQPAHDSGSPLIALAGDGNITLRVEQRPLEWVLEQIVLQGGGSLQDLLRRPEAAAHGKGLPASAPCSTPDSPGTAEELLRTIERGDEASRHDGLLQARGLGMAVPDDTLKTLFETDASDRVRLLAFESWLESRADSPDAMRSALQSALYLPSAAIQQEAKRLLTQLHEVERNAADSPQLASP
jgi:hypothetical protein